MLNTYPHSRNGDTAEKFHPSIDNFQEENKILIRLVTGRQRDAKIFATYVKNCRS